MSEKAIELLFSKLSEININLTMDTYWLILILPFIASAIGAYAGSYLKKKGEFRAIDENIESLKKQLKDTTKITEGIRSELDKITHKHKYKFEKYHEKSIEVIQNLYELLMDIELTSTTYIESSKSNEGHKDRFIDAKESITNYINYSNKSIFWVPENLYTEIEDLAVLSDKHIHSIFIKTSSQLEGYDNISMGFDETEAAIKSLQKELPKAKASIINSVRAIINP